MAGLGERGGAAGARPRARPALSAARSAARARPSGDHQAARLGRPAFGGDAAVPLAGPGAGPGSGRSAAARDDPALRRCAGRAAEYPAAESPPAESAVAAAAVAAPEVGGATGIWPLVGRETELATLRAAWQATGTAGRGGAIAGRGGGGEKRL